ncbi:MAG: hypothetical protein NXI24_20705 [bacterium]|nr:hypothetical protein [bacterium]
MVREDLKDRRAGDFRNRLRREFEFARSPFAGDLLSRAGYVSPLPEFLQRLESALDSPDESAAHDTKAAGFPPRGERSRNNPVDRGLAVAAEFARALWRRSWQKRRDDLELYWARLRMLDALANFLESRELLSLDVDRALRVFDSLSRNLVAADATSSGDPPSDPDRRQASPREKIVWLTGFDPYGLDPARPESFWNTNPSGAAVLAMHDRRMVGASGRGFRVQGAIFPVRFDDFTEGRVEKFLSDQVYAGADCELLFTISMGGSPEAFHIDRFPGNCRGDHPDNAGVIAGPASILPARDVVGLYGGDKIGGAPAFVEHSLASRQLKAMRDLPEAKAHFRVRDHRAVVFEKSGKAVEVCECEAADLSELTGAGNVRALRGAGGDYLSNEITFRVLWGLARRERFSSGSLTRPISAHIHTPRLSGGSEKAYAQTLAKRNRIVEQIEAMIVAAM